MRLSTLLIIVVIVGGGVFAAHKLGYIGKMKEAGDSFEAHFDKGSAAYTTGNLQGAIDELNKAVAINPKHEDAPTAYMKMGDSYKDMKDIPKAIEMYQKVINDYPDYKGRGQVEKSLMKTQELGYN